MTADPARITRQRPASLRPASLRGRVVLGVLVLLIVLLAALFATVDALLTARLHADLRTRLTDRVALADQLDGALSPQQLVDRLRGDGVTATLCSATGNTSTSGLRCVTADTTPGPPGRGPGPGSSGSAPSGSAPSGSVPSDPPSRPSAPAVTGTTVKAAGPVLFVRTMLPSTGQTLTLSVDSSQVGATVQRLVVLELIGGVVALALAALLLGRVVATALRPLDHMTALARQIAAGDRGQRLGTGRPDTELGRTAGAFDDMLDELESALRASTAADLRLRSFLSDVSHELRTPLTGLAATTEALLVSEPDADERERAYVTLVRETQRAGRLVDDLLTVTRLDTGMSLQTGPVDLREVATQELERIATLEPQLTLRLEAPAAVVVRGDAVRLGQIIGNLLSNARTAAGPAGHVTTTITTTPHGWRLDVHDDGPGVAPVDRERIFERLVRLDDSRSRERGGFGLGLPIARMLARAHGGDLACIDPPDGCGACFELTLPRGR